MQPDTSQVFEIFYISVIISAFYIQGQSYFDPLVKATGVQSFLVAITSFLMFQKTGLLDFVYLGTLIALVRGFVTPHILLRVLGKRYGERERISGFASLLVIDLAFFFTAVLMLYNYVLTKLFPDHFTLVFAFALLFQGLYLMASRTSTPSQMAGYLEEENALVLFGISLIPVPFLIEASVALDVLGLVVISAVVIKEKKEHVPLEELRG